jgi:hypothetical protein
VRAYCGRGPAVARLAAEDETRRLGPQGRQAWAMEQERLVASAERLMELTAMATVVTEAVMVPSGDHLHRGQ